STVYYPPVLIANNVVYSNGAACIEVYEQTGGHWVINNTCYKNGLDLQAGGCASMTRGCQYEYLVKQTHNNYLVNNIASSWDIQHPYSSCCNSSSNELNHNLWWGAGSNELSGFNVTSLTNANPLFVNP